MQTTIQYIKNELAGLYPESETESFARLIFEAVCGWNFTQQLIYRNEKIQKREFEEITVIVSRLKSFEPIQYILGRTEFFGLTLEVNPSVLIPRPETEELVQWVIGENIAENCRILDIGTGSGCIAIAIKSRLKNNKVTGVDISKKAIEMARKNAHVNGLEVDFLQADILNWHIINWPKYDVIVSNPPYIRESEKPLMHANVLNFEPGNALFVSDTNPLVFYRAIALFAKSSFNEKGKLYFEINENLGFETVEMLGNEGFYNIELKKDINGKNRMIKCIYSIQ